MRTVQLIITSTIFIQTVNILYICICSTEEEKTCASWRGLGISWDLCRQFGSGFLYLKETINIMNLKSSIATYFNILREFEESEFNPKKKKTKRKIGRKRIPYVRIANMYF